MSPQNASMPPSKPVAIAARAMLRGVRADEYTESCSVFKDAALGALDLASKAGLALFVALRAHDCAEAARPGCG